MINRLYFKDNLSFKSCELEFSPGLNVISGASGAGKSVLFKGILSAFALADATAAVLCVESSLGVNLPEFDDDGDGGDGDDGGGEGANSSASAKKSGASGEAANSSASAKKSGASGEAGDSGKINIYSLKKEKSTRYFYNHQSISKRLLSGQMSEQISYLGANKAPELEGARVLKIIDELGSAEDSAHAKALADYQANFAELAAAKAELAELLASEADAAAKCEFLEFEINKITAAKLKPGEYDKLLKMKSNLAKADKLAAAIDDASGVFDYLHKIQSVLKIAGEDDAWLIDAFAQLEDIFASLAGECEELNIEQIMQRLDEIVPVVKKYGGEEEALAALAAKRAELEMLSDVEFNKSQLEKRIKNLQKTCEQIAGDLSKRRCLAARRLEGKISDYLSALYLRDLGLNLTKTELKQSGADELQISLAGAAFKDISSGELNRLRLAFCAACAAFGLGGGVMFMDEIDANLSGKEAISIAKVITELAASYQVFVITHLPWLCARANCHILVERDGEQSRARVLKASEIQAELARMISDEETNESAMEFAKALLEQKENS